jgi:hypothetical protein
VLNPAAVQAGGRAITISAFFGVLGTRVCHYAINAILAQLQLATGEDELQPCTGYHRRVLGLPCAHDLVRKMDTATPLHLADVNVQWHIVPVACGYGDPRIIVPRRGPTPTGTSTRREPSQFERTIQRLCGICRNAGHDARACPRRLHAGNSS